jgi:hypothetical protein
VIAIVPPRKQSTVDLVFGESQNGITISEKSIVSFDVASLGCVTKPVVEGETADGIR